MLRLSTPISISLMVFLTTNNSEFRLEIACQLASSFSALTNCLIYLFIDAYVLQNSYPSLTLDISAGIHWM